MSAMPSKALMRAAINETFCLQDEQGAQTHAQLLSVKDGMPMNKDYVCYSAVFGLQEGVAATQGTYRVSHKAGEVWPLFMTSIISDATGRARLEALFHYRVEVQPEWQEKNSE